MEEAMNISGNDIAVIGMACRFPGAKNTTEFWENLKNGLESVVQFSDEELVAAGVDPELLKNPDYVKSGVVLEDLEMFDAGFFGLSPKEAAIMDPQHRQFLECSWEALEDSGYSPDKYNAPIGVFGGCGMNSYFIFNLLTNPQLIKSTGLFLLRHTGNDKDFLTTRVSYCFNLSGPSINVQTACSTSLVAIHYACQSLLSGECDIALAGGVTIDIPARQGYLYQEGEILSPDGHCRAFDHNSKGTIFGSGAGVIVLKRLADALKDGDIIHSVVKGSAVNNDGAMKVGYLAPSVDGQSVAIMDALSIADINPETIGYIETHGTGTPIGDPIEVAALTEAFRSRTNKSQFCRIGSIKTNIGHLDTAAGVAGFIKSTLALKNSLIPPSLNFEKPNPTIDFENSPFFVNDKLTEWKTNGHPRRAGISSLGVGGTNAHIIIEEAPKLKNSSPSRDSILILLSARSEKAVNNAVSSLAAFLEKNIDINLADAAYTLQVGRKNFQHKKAFACSNAKEAIEILRSNDKKRILTGITEDSTKELVFMFPGGGVQYPYMGLDLYKTESVYRENIDKSLAYIKLKFGLDLKIFMFPEKEDFENASYQLQNPRLSILSIFITEYAIAKLFISWGIKPDSMTGHSLGEYTAACLAGTFSLEDALNIVELRGRIFEKLPQGGMLSINASEEEVLPFLGEKLSIAAINSPQLCVVSGELDEISSLEEALNVKGLECSRLKISVAAHSEMLEPFLSEFRSGFNKIKFNKPSIPFISNLTGQWINPEEACSPDYWVKHLRNTVRFSDGMKELLKSNNMIFLEVGPGNALTSLSQNQIVKINSQKVISSMRHPKEYASDIEYIIRAVGKLWINGIDINWNLYYKNEFRRRVSLPTYPFEHQPYWIGPGKLIYTAEEADDTLKKVKNITDWFYKRSWETKESFVLNEKDLIGTPKKWLLFVNDNSFHFELLNRLKNLNQNVIIVSPGASFISLDDEFYINPSEPADYVQLIKETGIPDYIVHLWSHNQLSLDVFKRYNINLQMGFYSIMFLAQALGNEEIISKVKLVAAANNITQINHDEEIYPEKAAMAGALKVIPKEIADISTRLISISTEIIRTDDFIAESIVESNDDIVILKEGKRWIEIFSKEKIDVSENIRIKQNGVYLITGGLGGMGLTFAGFLAEYNAKIVLLSRSSFHKRSEWPDLLQKLTHDNEETIIIKKIIEMEAKGAEILIISADVSDLFQMKDAVDMIYKKYGRIDGVIHGAGVINDGVIQFKSKKDAERVLAPKVFGTLVLDELLKEKELDFFLLFSSVSSLIGSAGQIDYAAANAFLDSYAQSSVGTKRYTLSLNWGQWQEVGMAARLAVRLGISEEKERIVKKLDHPLISNCLSINNNSAEYSSHLSIKNTWLLDEHKTKSGINVMPGTGYIELARAAFEDFTGKTNIKLENVVFLSPFVVPENESKELKIKIDLLDGVYEFVIYSEEEHVKGQISLFDKNSIPNTLEFINGKEVNYHEHKFMEFGKRWQNIDGMTFEDNTANIRLKLPDEYISDLNIYKLHPALLDMATGGAQQIAGYDLDNEFYVPVSYGTLEIYNGLNNEMISCVQYIFEQSSNNTAVFDIQLYNKQGVLLLNIKNFVMKKLSGTGFDLHSSNKNKVQHKHQNTGNKILAIGQKEGIKPSEGIEVLKRILSNDLGPQIIAVSQDFKALMATMNSSLLGENGNKTSETGRPQLSNSYEAPRSKLEEEIAVIWQDVLGVDKIGINDDFLELGGHSLLLTRLIMRVRKKYKIDLQLSGLFENPTVASFALEVDKALSNQGEEEILSIKSVERDSFKVKVSSDAEVN